ncbi:MAG: hypothetical protein ABH821_04055 [archaeon]
MTQEEFEFFNTWIKASGWICNSCGNMKFEKKSAKKAIKEMKELERN